MKYIRTPQFREDCDILSRTVPNIYDLLRTSFPLVDQALNGDSSLYQHFRIKKMQGHTNIWEGHIRIDICFTFHFEIDEEREKNCIFRRIGSHQIYNNP